MSGALTRMLGRTPAGGGGSFGYQSGDGTGVNIYGLFAAEHDTTQYTNNFGSTVAVATITLIQIAGVRFNNTATVKAALYADSGSDTPAGLLGQSGTQTIAASTQPTVTFTLGSPVNVTNGTKVWVAFDTTDDIFFNGATHSNDGKSFRYKTRPGGGTFSDPFGASTGFGLIIPATLSA